MSSQDIIHAIEAHSRDTGLSPATITFRAVGNSQLYRRLKAGGSCTLRIAEKLAAYIRDHSPVQPPSRGSL